MGARTNSLVKHAALTLVGASALFACCVASAHALVVVDQSTHQHFGVAPAMTSAAASAAATTPFQATTLQGSTCNAENGDCTALSYNGGPVQHGESDYLFFWAPSGHSAPSEYVTGIRTWLEEVAAADRSTSNPFAANRGYYDLSGAGGSKSYVPYAISYAGTVTDTDSYPANGCSDRNAEGGGIGVCLTNGQIVNELSSYITAHSLPTGIDVEYFVLTPEGVGSCFDSSNQECSYTSYCGYHSYAGSGSSQIVYADLPWAYKVYGCDVNMAFKAGYPNSDKIDSVISVFSHELSETMTDPNLDAWYQVGGTDNGYEIGDKCAYIYGAGGYASVSGLGNDGTGYWNVALAGNRYLMQLEFANGSDNCALEYGPTAAFSVTSSSPRAGQAVAFSASASSAPEGSIKEYSWSWGDGTAAGSGVAPSHTYIAAGTYTVTLTVTARSGTSAEVSRDVTVGAASGGSGGSSGGGSPEGGSSGAGSSGASGSSSSTATQTSKAGGTSTTTTTTTAAAATSGVDAKTPAKTTSSCHTVTRRVRGRARRVRVCARPKSKSKKAHGTSTH